MRGWEIGIEGRGVWDGCRLWPSFPIFRSVSVAWGRVLDVEEGIRRVGDDVLGGNKKMLGRAGGDREDRVPIEDEVSGMMLSRGACVLFVEGEGGAVDDG